MNKNIENLSNKWYAVYTKPRAEKQVLERLEEKGVETYLPLQKTYKQWSDRKKLIEKPLLPSYIFVKICRKQFPEVYTTSGVVRFILFESMPVSIPQNQIDNLRILIDSDAKVEVISDKYSKGDNVEVVRGSMIGLTGELIKIGNQNRVIIRIDRLDQNIIVKIPVTFLRKM